MFLMNKAKKFMNGIVKGYNSMIQNKGVKLYDFVKSKFSPTDRGIDILCSYISRYYKKVDESTLICGDIEERYIFELYRETRKSILFYTRDKEIDVDDVMFHLDFFKEIQEFVEDDKHRALATFIVENYIEKVTPSDKSGSVYVFFTGFVKHPWKTDWQVAELIAAEFFGKMEEEKENGES